MAIKLQEAKLSAISTQSNKSEICPGNFKPNRAIKEYCSFATLHLKLTVTLGARSPI